MENFSNEAYYLFFSTLSNRTRLAIIDVLREGPKNISGISEALEQNETTVAYNLKRLEHSALLRSESLGKEKLYSLNREIIEPLSELLAFHTNKYCPRLKNCIPPEKLKEYMKKEAAKETFIEHA
jgi:DNA-binding transcriptional ArsR family regulator